MDPVTRSFPWGEFTMGIMQLGGILVGSALGLAVLILIVVALAGSIATLIGRIVKSEDK